MNITKSFTFNGATVTVRRADMRARLMGQFVWNNFDISEDMPIEEFKLYEAFVAFMTQMHVEGSLGFEIPSVTAERAVIHETFEKFMALDGSFYDDYVIAFSEVAKDPGNPDTTPDAKKNEIEKS